MDGADESFVLAHLVGNVLVVDPLQCVEARR